MSKQKRQGTSWEQEIIARAQAEGLEAWPLARRGPSDPGDVVIRSSSGDCVVVEARDRQRMSVHPELAEAKGQTARADLPFIPWMTVIAWKRLGLKEGNVRRSQVGEPVVVLGFNDFLGML